MKRPQHEIYHITRRLLIDLLKHGASTKYQICFEAGKRILTISPRLLHDAGENIEQVIGHLNREALGMWTKSNMDSE